jgi:protease-4
MTETPSDNDSRGDSAPPPPQQPQQSAPPPPQVVVTSPQQKSSTLKRMFTAFMGIVFLASIVLNVYLLMIIGLQMAGPMEKQTYIEGEGEAVVAMYTIEGVIDGEAADGFETFYRDVSGDENVKAVVLRVNSPGGGVGASDRMYARVLDLQEKGKPVVVSMGTVAASGGYYIAAPADRIYAEHTTTTGSIGVIAAWMVFSGTLDKLGIEPVVMKSDRARAWKDELWPLDKPDDRQREHLQKMLNDIQERFEAVVRKGRGEKIETKTHTYPLEVNRDGEEKTIQYTETEPFNGKVYVGPEAVDMGLVDEIGYLDAAIEKARELTGAKDSTVVEYIPRRGLMETIMQGRSGSAAVVSKEMIEELRTPKIQLLWRVE